MMRQPGQSVFNRVFFAFALGFCLVLTALVVYLAVEHGENDLHSFSESVVTLADDWTLTDGEGVSRVIDLPATVECGEGGFYTLSRTLPEVAGALVTPALRFYSNYVDVRVALDDTELYAFPNAKGAFSGATGNTYHFVRLPADYAGKRLTVTLRCQLGRDITYLLNPPLLGSKATMLKRDVLRSLPTLTLAGCMGLMACGLGVLYLLFRKRLDLNNATLYTALFTLLFAVYVYFETSFAQLLMPNGYLLCFTTLMLLALVPIPLIGVFLDAVGARFRKYLYAMMTLCSLNLTLQLILNFSGVLSVRAMLPATHAVIILSMLVAVPCLLFSDRTEKPDARRELLSAVPMIIGGLADIVLLNLNSPSPNNSLWFVLGVTTFILIQLCGFIGRYFALYRASLEASLLTDMAYRDLLTGIDNRNAYERKLKSLSADKPPERLCCIVMDINDLKLINDTLGHQAGDTAIAEIGRLLAEYMPKSASYFRTGGDEFVILIEEYDEPLTRDLAERLSEEAKKRGRLRSIPISLAIGYGQFVASDDSVVDFIRRVDTLMYECKRRQKASAAFGRAEKIIPAFGEADFFGAHGRKANE